MIDNAIERFSYIMDEKTIQIEYDSNNRYELNADRLRTSQVIINLLSNAFNMSKIMARLRLRYQTKLIN